MLKFRDSNKRLVVCLIIGAQYGCTAGVRKCCDSSKLVSVHCALRPVFVDAVPIPGTLGVLASCSQPPAVPRLYSYCLVWKVHISCQDIYSSLLIGFLWTPSPVPCPQLLVLCYCQIGISEDIDLMSHHCLNFVFCFSVVLRITSRLLSIA